MKKLMLVLVVVAVVALLAYTQRASIAERVMERGIASRMGQDITAEYVDGLHVALCGAGGPMPAPNASGPCVAVVAGDTLLIIDVGTDSPRNLGRMNYPVGNVDAVLLTHFHSDHIDGLGELATLRWAGGGNDAPLPVYGPPGVDRVVEGFNLAYSQDFRYRHEHHGNLVADLGGAGLTPRPFAMPSLGELVSVYADGDLTVTALAVEHSPVSPAVGYLINYKDRSALITGDTSKFDNTTTFAEGVDLLVHEALAPNLVRMMEEGAKKIGNEVMAKIAYDIPDYHASPVEAAETARDAGVGHLLYYHIVPPLLLPGQDVLFLNGAEKVFQAYTIGQDGVSFALPAESDEILLIRDSL
ncbi:MAG: MBL fold metallo-hydrolase [Pseudomonadota bacterium]